jgi:hypothetical protein
MEIPVIFRRRSTTMLRFLLLLVVAAALLGAAPEKAFAQGQFQTITGADFDAAAPNTVNIGGKQVSVAKRSAVLLQTPSGGRAFFAIQDGTGYTTDVASQKSAGVITIEGGSLSIAGKPVAAGKYTFSWTFPPKGEDGPGTFSLFSQANAKLTEVSTPRDAGLKTPTPLQVVVQRNGTAARLYNGRYSVELR